MQWDRHKKAKKEIEKIFNKYETYRIIHYSCQSFYRVEIGKTAIITSIAIYSCISDTTKSFDIQSTAEKLKIDYERINEKIEVIERQMLKEFFDYIKEDRQIKYLHWNMRDSQYGFQALSHRYSVLTGEMPEYEIPDSNQINIARLLDEFYRVNYVADPKMENLVKLNPEIKPKFILYGREEADAFDEGRYNELHRSTLSKVRLFNNILIMVSDNKLKESTNKIQAFGLSPQVVFEMLKEKWWWGLITFFLGIVFGKFLGG